MPSLDSLRLTRRGRLVLGACVVGFALAALSGARSLNAVVLPGFVALAAAYLQLSRLDPPSVRRDLPPDDFVGTTHDVTLHFSDRRSPGKPLEDPFVATVRDTPGEGIDGPAEPVDTTVGARPVTYEVTYEDRGDRELGPVTLTARDVFGILERDLLCPGKGSVLVYPERFSVPGWFRRELYHEDALGTSRQRDEFDRLREYARGDALRDVNWSATAKRDDLIVNEFAAETDQRRVVISGGARGGAADDLARSLTSIALSLLDDGIPVTVSVPNGREAIDTGPDDRRRLLELLARTPEGSVPESDADVVVDADHAGTTIRIDDREVSFAELVDRDGGVGSSASAGSGRRGVGRERRGAGGQRRGAGGQRRGAGGQRRGAGGQRRGAGGDRRGAGRGSRQSESRTELRETDHPFASDGGGTR